MIPKVLFVTSVATGPDRPLDPLIRQLHPESLRFEIALVGETSSPRRQPRYPHVPTHVLSGTGAIGFCRNILRLRSLISSTRPDIVHASQFIPAVLMEFTRLTMRRAPTSIVSRHHNEEHHLLGKRLHVYLDRWTARRSSKVAVVSQAVRQTLESRERVPVDHIEVIPNGLDSEDVLTTPEGVARWKDRFKGYRLLVAVGRLNPMKDYPTLLRAFARVSEQHEPLALAIAGTGSDEARISITRLAEELAVADRVHLLGWVEDVYNLMSAGDTFVQASLDESFALTVLEALLLRVPLAVTTPGGVQELVGGVYPSIRPGDDLTLAREISHRLDDPLQARQLAENAAGSLQGRYSTGAMVQSYLALYLRMQTNVATERPRAVDA